MDDIEERLKKLVQNILEGMPTEDLYAWAEHNNAELYLSIQEFEPFVWQVDLMDKTTHEWAKTRVDLTNKVVETND